MATRATTNISLPPSMRKHLDLVSRKSERTRSEIVREALRLYFNLPTYTPTARELREIEKGRSSMRHGEYYTLDEFKDVLLGGARSKARSKKRAPRSTSRARTA